MSKEIYVYSGIQPGKKGTGNFLSFFIHKLQQENINFKLIAYKTPSLGFIRKIAKLFGVIKILRSVYLNLVRISIQDKIRDGVVFIFHPQSIGLKLTSELIESNKTYIYVLDSFFFCKKSYNHLEGIQACFQCIDNPKASDINNCKLGLSIQIDNEYNEFIKVISQNLNSICFLTQNDNQSFLLKKKFGSSVKYKKLGMLINLERESQSNSRFFSNYHFVYHNTNLKAKGVEYFLGLAEVMPEYKFLMPYSKNELVTNVGTYENLTNVDFISMSWETGLKYEIENCRIVLNPSLWSAPVEGALLKSIYHNGAVAVLDTNLSFQQEIPDNVLIKLSNDFMQSKKILTKVLQSDFEIALFKQNSKDWLTKYRECSNLLFDEFLKEVKSLN
jgi:hypothetical protein